MLYIIALAIVFFFATWCPYILSFLFLRIFQRFLQIFRGQDPAVCWALGTAHRPAGSRRFFVADEGMKGGLGGLGLRALGALGFRLRAIPML